MFLRNFVDFGLVRSKDQFSRWIWNKPNIMWNLSTNHINQLPITTIVKFLFGIFDEQIWFFFWSLVYQWNKISKGVFYSIVLPLRNNSDILNININIYLNPWSELSPSYLGNCYCIHSSEFKYCSSTEKNVVQKKIQKRF